MNLRPYYKLKYCHERIKFCTGDAEDDLSTCLRHISILLNHCVQVQREIFASPLLHGSTWFYFSNAEYRIFSIEETIPTISSTLVLCALPFSICVTPHLILPSIQALTHCQSSAKKVQITQKNTTLSLNKNGIKLKIKDNE